jgi:hypothetical protein
MDMTVHSDCEEPDRGTLVVQGWGRGDGVDSEHMVIFPEQDDPGPFSIFGEERRPYFPARTISLEEHEEVIILVDVIPGRPGTELGDPARVQVCEVTMSLEIRQGDTKTEQTVPGSFRFMDVEPQAAYDEYEHVYIGTGLCKSLREVRSELDWTSLTDACGLGNVSPNVPGG